MQVVSFINMKGGVGKTTLAFNVGYGLAYYHGKKVLIVDADPQFNATTCLMSEDAYIKHLHDGKGTIYDIFKPRRSGPISTLTGRSKPPERNRSEPQSYIVPIYTPRGSSGRLDLVPSTLNLIEVENAQRGAERKLRLFIQQKAQGYDFVIIDCPPTISIFTQAAILASQKYLVPIKPDPLSVIGLPLLERWLEEFTEDAGISLSRVGIVLTLVRGPTPARMKQVIADLRADRPGEVFAAEMREATAVASSAEAHSPVFLYKSNSASADQARRITADFLRRVEIA